MDPRVAKIGLCGRSHPHDHRTPVPGRLCPTRCQRVRARTPQRNGPLGIPSLCRA
jgi:hypothetical protein